MRDRERGGGKRTQSSHVPEKYRDYLSLDMGLNWKTQRRWAVEIGEGYSTGHPKKGVAAGEARSVSRTNSGQEKWGTQSRGEMRQKQRR